MYPKHELLIGKSKQTLRAHIYPTATVNILSERDYENLNPKPKLRNEETETPIIFGFPTLIVGQFVARLQNEDSTTIADFYILPDTINSIITLNVAKKLSLLEKTTRAEFPRKERENDTQSKSNTQKTTENEIDIRKPTEQNERKETAKEINKNERKISTNEHRKTTEHINRNEPKNKKPKPIADVKNKPLQHTKDVTKCDEEIPKLSTPQNSVNSKPIDISPTKKKMEKFTNTCSKMKQHNHHRYLFISHHYSSVPHTLNNQKQNTYTSHITKIKSPYSHFSNEQFTYITKRNEHFEHSKFRKKRIIRTGQGKKKKKKEVNILIETHIKQIKTDCET